VGKLALSLARGLSQTAGFLDRLQIVVKLGH
jgi:hypothetical protein